MKYKTIDLCAGIGGIRRGFELTGQFENILSAEIDPYAVQTYQHLFGEAESPLNDLTSEEFKRKVVDTEYDILLAGFPCQTFSRVGKRLGFRDSTRGTVFFDIADIISRTHPKAVFLENVENIISHDGGNTIERIVKTLEDELEYRIIGVTLDEDGAYSYSSKSFIRNTRNFGLPQNRPRAYIMAFSKKVYGDTVKLLSEGLPTEGEEVIYKDITEILEKVVDDRYYMASGYLETLKKHKARQKDKGYGFGYCVVNKKPDLVANTILATGGSGKERNLIYQPKDGVSGKSLKGKKTPLNSEGIRVMTPIEWGRLQGFIGYGFLDAEGKERFSFPDGITDGQMYKQLGNSVSIPVIKCMAEFMLKCFDKMTIHQESIVDKLAKENILITKRQVMEVLRISSCQANYLMRKLVDDGRLELLNRGRYAKYRRPIR